MSYDLLLVQRKTKIKPKKGDERFVGASGVTFTDQGSVVEIFTDLNVWMGIRNVIGSINENARVA